MINDLCNAMWQQYSAYIIETIVNDMITHAVYHFTMEEKY